MSGNTTGALQTVAKLKAQDPDHYKKIGSKGGKAGTGTEKGFARSSDLASRAGKLGAIARSLRRQPGV